VENGEGSDEGERRMDGGERVELPEFAAARGSRALRWALSRTIPDLCIVAEAGWRRFS
jgi:hypothetical protein